MQVLSAPHHTNKMSYSTTLINCRFKPMSFYRVWIKERINAHFNTAYLCRLYPFMFFASVRAFSWYFYTSVAESVEMLSCCCATVL